MGLPGSAHIRAFVKGQTIDDMVEDSTGHITFRFTSGEFLRLHTRVKRQVAEIETIAIPFRADGEVKQSTEILQK